MRNAWALISVTAAALLAAVVLAVPGVHAQAPQPKLDLAVMEAPAGTTLDDILTGRAQPGFTPVLTPGFAFTARDERVLWVRVRTELPAGDHDWRLGVVRVPLEHLRLRLHPPGTVVARESFFNRGDDQRPWPSHFDLPLPAGLSGPAELYLELEGRVMGGLHVSLRDAAAAQAQAEQARFWFRVVYALLLLVAATPVLAQRVPPAPGCLDARQMAEVRQASSRQLAVQEHRVRRRRLQQALLERQVEAELAHPRGKARRPEVVAAAVLQRFAHQLDHVDHRFALRRRCILREVAELYRHIPDTRTAAKVDVAARGALCCPDTDRH